MKEIGAKKKDQTVRKMNDKENRGDKRRGKELTWREMRVSTVRRPGIACGVFGRCFSKTSEEGKKAN